MTAQGPVFRAGRADIMAGKLFICATPIGNLDDITLRVLDALRGADLIAAEDTRHTRGLLAHFDIHTPMTSYHEHNRFEKAEEIADRLEEGLNVCLVTDAGTPAVSDPGEVLVKTCIERGIEVTSLPGASACITALTLSGLDTRRFCFEAFLPMKKKERDAVLESLRSETRTSIIYEAPHRIKGTLAELSEALGPDRGMALCRELTKVHETVWRGTLGEAAAYFSEKDIKGEIVLVIAGATEDELRERAASEWEGLSVAEHVQKYTDSGMSRKDAMKAAAADRGISRRDIYQALI